MGRAAAWLGTRGSPTPRLDAELLLAHALGVDRLDLYTGHERPLTRIETDAFRTLVARRGRREPVAYLTGRRAFRGLELHVTPAVLVPRPETEHLVERALALAPPDGRVLDWGTGSGAVALALADERPDLRVCALDRDPAALDVARANAARLGREVELVLSDGFARLRGRRFDLVVANPPYLSEVELTGAPPELAHEPREALLAGPTGLEALERLAREGPAHLAPGGHLVAEVGRGQAAAVTALWGAAGLRGVVCSPDLAGVARVVSGTRVP
jgi:release factor glutamine methyltransferase